MEVLAVRPVKQDEQTYKRWFDYADTDNDGRLTGPDVVKLFALSQLPRGHLKQVWAVADAKRQGFLGFKEFVAAMQMISLAQASGKDVSADMLSTCDAETISPPNMDGLEELLMNGHMSSSQESTCNGNVNGHANGLANGHAHENGNGTTPQLQLQTSKWFSQKPTRKIIPAASVTSIVDGLKKLYLEKLKPLEIAYRFHDFALPMLTESDFDAKPSVMLLGQYSTGKTTFIKHLLGSSYPGAHVGPEPTTDRFVVVMEGADERSIPGNTIAVQGNMPFTGLTKFGGAFLSKFECSQMPHPLLEHLTFVDTPGVLSGEKQRTQRSYEFTGVTEWFAAKCDMILLLFDPHKLDISDEFKRVIMSLHGQDDKIRVVLNKADQVGTQQLMRVYGALMWSLGKVLKTPEVMRVYIGSFNDKPINENQVGPIGKVLFEQEQNDLLDDLKDIPRKACDRKINEFVKRARAAKIHACIMGHLKKEMPTMMGKAKAQQRLIDTLEDEFAKVQRELNLPAGDFPNVEHYQEVLSECNIDKFEKLKPKMLQTLDDMLSVDIPDLIKKFRNPYD